MSPELDAQTGTILVRGLFKNPNRDLIPGFFARVRVPMGLGATAVAADAQPGHRRGPGRASTRWSSTRTNVVEQRRIKTGQLLVGGLRVITEGLAADDRVVLTTNGQAVPGGKVVPQTSRRRRTPPASRRPSRPAQR